MTFRSVVSALHSNKFTTKWKKYQVRESCDVSSRHAAIIFGSRLAVNCLDSRFHNLL
jgi:hypothetical protein